MEGRGDEQEKEGGEREGVVVWCRPTTTTEKVSGSEFSSKQRGRPSEKRQDQQMRI
jgi:hypothetical protein